MNSSPRHDKTYNNLVSNLQKDFGDQIRYLKKCKGHIVLSDCRDEELEVVMGLLDDVELQKEVKSLVVQGFITKLPDTIRQFKWLHTLTLDDNRLTEFPTQVFDLPRLKHLSLANNQISGVPADIGRLRELELLSLKDNTDMGPLPSEIGECTALTSLDIRGTGISEFPDNARNWRNCNILPIQKARDYAKQFEEKVEGDHHHIESYLKQKDVNSKVYYDIVVTPPRAAGGTGSSMSSHVFEEMMKCLPFPEQIVSLSIAGHHIEQFPQSVVNMLPNLRQLDLSDCMLTTLPSNFSNLSRLSTLNLSKNQFEDQKGLKQMLAKNRACEAIFSDDDTITDSISKPQASIHGAEVWNRGESPPGFYHYRAKANWDGKPSRKTLNAPLEQPQAERELELNPRPATLEPEVEVEWSEVPVAPQTRPEVSHHPMTFSVVLDCTKPFDMSSLLRVTPNDSIELKVSNYNKAAFERFIEALSQAHHLSQVTALDLSQNKMETLSDSISRLDGLKVLNLSDNRLRTFSEDLMLFKLQALNLANNQLSCAPALNMKKLTQLDIRYNRIVKEPNYPHLPHLDMLCDGNYFHTIKEIDAVRVHRDNHDINQLFERARSVLAMPANPHQTHDDNTGFLIDMYDALSEQLSDQIRLRSALLENSKTELQSDQNALDEFVDDDVLKEYTINM